MESVNKHDNNSLLVDREGNNPVIASLPECVADMVKWAGFNNGVEVYSIPEGVIANLHGKQMLQVTGCILGQ